MMRIPIHEIDIHFSRSGGPGGQNVNKVASKAHLRWRVGESSAFSLEEKDAIRSALVHRMNAYDEIMIDADGERSQGQNKAAAIRRLQELVRQSLVSRKRRRATKPTYGSKARRLEEKKRISDKKQKRRPVAP